MTEPDRELSVAPLPGIEEPAELVLNADIDKLRPDDFVRTRAGLDSVDEYGMWVRVHLVLRGDPTAQTTNDESDGDPVHSIEGEVCCFPPPTGIENGDVYTIEPDQILEIVTKEELPGQRVDAFLRSPKIYDPALAQEFRDLAEEERAERPAAAELEPSIAPADNFFEPLDAQVERLADFIIGEVPGEPSRSEGAIDCAIRIIREQALSLELARGAMARQAEYEGAEPGEETDAAFEAALRGYGTVGSATARTQREPMSTGSLSLNGSMVLDARRECLRLAAGIPGSASAADMVTAAKTLLAFLHGGDDAGGE